MASALIQHNIDSKSARQSSNMAFQNHYNSPKNLQVHTKAQSKRLIGSLDSKRAVYHSSSSKEPQYHQKPSAAQEVTTESQEYGATILPQGRLSGANGRNLDAKRGSDDVFGRKPMYQEPAKGSRQDNFLNGYDSTSPKSIELRKKKGLEINTSITSMPNIRASANSRLLSTKNLGSGTGTDKYYSGPMSHKNADPLAQINSNSRFEARGSESYSAKLSSQKPYSTEAGEWSSTPTGRKEANVLHRFLTYAPNKANPSPTKGSPN